MRRRPISGVLFAGGGSVAAAAIGALGSRRAPKVYARLDKPSWAPPAAVFGPVWTAIYTTIAVAAWRVWTRDASCTVLSLHASQLALNAAWPFAFFGARNRSVAVSVIAALDLTVAAEIAAAAREDRPAAVLLAPYLAWCLYATALTVAIRPENRT